MSETELNLESVEVSSSPLERFEEYLDSRGKRVTQQRRFIVEKVFSRHEHFEVDDLVAELVHAEQPVKVSRPTIYRTITEMVEAGLLRKISLVGRTVYEHDYGYPQHDHLYCQTCQKLIEFQSKELIELRKSIAIEHEFLAKSFRLIINGVCKECQDARRKRRKVDRV